MNETQKLMLSPQAQLVHQHMVKNEGITAREAMADYGMTSATLARRICDLEEVGIHVRRVRRAHPVTGQRYTRYRIYRDSGRAAQRG